jgi:hypothetical protein
MLTNAIHAERDRLEHQRWRIQEILSHRMVSPEMESHLCVRLRSITQRLTVLDDVAAETALAPRQAVQQQPRL